MHTGQLVVEVLVWGGGFCGEAVTPPVDVILHALGWHVRDKRLLTKNGQHGFQIGKLRMVFQEYLCCVCQLAE